MIKAMMAVTAILFLMGPQETRAQDVRTPQAYELTSRGVIAAAAMEAYKEALEPCAGTPGSAPHGPKFVACLRRQLHSENGTLASAYNATATVLRPTADRVAKLRDAQAAWRKFRDENCAFARLVAPREVADEFFYDCLLRATVDRRVELRSLVGD